MNHKNPKTQEAMNILLDWQDRLRQTEELENFVKTRLKEIGISGYQIHDWKASCENNAISAIVKTIKGDANLPIDYDKIAKIPEENGKPYSIGYGRWLTNTTPEMLANWIETKIGNPIQKEIQNTIEEVFPKYLRNEKDTFDDDKKTVSFWVTSFESSLAGKKMQHKYYFKPEPWIAFLKLCHSIGGNIPFEESYPPIPEILDRNFKCERANLYRWHPISGNAGIIRIRVMTNGIWRFELRENVYPHIKALGKANYDKHKKDYS